MKPTFMFLLFWILFWIRLTELTEGWAIFGQECTKLAKLLDCGHGWQTKEWNDTILKSFSVECYHDDHQI